MAGKVIGIDLGTSNSCVAIAEEEERRVLSNAQGEAITPSVVHFQEDGAITVGSKAKHNVIHNPDSTIYSAKRLIGRYFFSDEVKKAKAVYSYGIEEGPDHSVRIRVRDEVLSLAEVSAMVLREMKQIAEENLGEDVTQAVITVPAFFNDNQRQATRDAGQIAGLEVSRILNEPTAAALAYGFGKELDQRVAVYDLGGGTFDISILEISNDVFEVLSTAGDTYLGGDDFDDRLIDLFADKFFAEHKINLRNDPHAYEKIKLAAEEVKKQLSTQEEVSWEVSDLAEDEEGNPLTLTGKITSQEFTTLVMDLIQRTFKVCDEAMQQAGLVTRDLDGIILVGGPTRLPVVRDSVKEYFQQEPKANIDPDQVVAVGAAIHARALASSDQDTHLLDVTPLSLRIGVAGGLAEPIIEANTPIPIEQTRSFTTFQDYQETVKILVTQGESRTSDENEMLGEFIFSGFETGRRGEVRIDVTFSINTDGIVEVTALDPTTGVKASTELTLSSGLSQDEIQTIMDKGRAEDVVTEAKIGTVKLVQVASHLVAAPKPVVAQTERPALPPSDEELGLDADDRDDLLGDDLELDGDPDERLELESDAELCVDPAMADTGMAAPLAADREDALELDEADLLLDGEPLELDESDDVLFGDVGTDLSTDDEEKQES